MKWIETDEGNFVDIHKAYIITYRPGKSAGGVFFFIKAYFLVNWTYDDKIAPDNVDLKTVKTKKEAEQYIRDIIKE